MARDRLPSAPIQDSRDEPRAISQAEFAAHLEAHRILEARLEKSRRSDPVTFSGHGLTVKGRGAYILAIGVLALVAFWLWLRK